MFIIHEYNNTSHEHQFWNSTENICKETQFYDKSKLLHSYRVKLFLKYHKIQLY